MPHCANTNCTYTGDDLDIVDGTANNHPIEVQMCPDCRT